MEYLIPSHVFYLVSSCNPESGFDAYETDLRKCPLEDLDTMAFIFPNTELNDDCLMVRLQHFVLGKILYIDIFKITLSKFIS